MTTQTEYSLKDKISDTSHASVYRAVRRADGLPVVLKCARSEYPSSEELAKLRHEHALLSSLELEGVPRSHGLVKLEGGALALVLDDVGGQSLDRVLRAARPELERFLELAVLLSKLVASIHREGILHKDIKPEHFFVDERSGGIKLIDFGLATRLSRERPQIVPTTIDGTFLYMSPEQTGRMNRSVDQRSDLYSLGITLYELLTGQPPFTSRDPLEIVHSHIARLPAAPSDVRADVPLVVSEIVMRLLAKVAEDRYQDAGGLSADLEQCLAAVRGGAGADIPPFPLGRNDSAGVLRLPQKLYGRDAELATLLAAFERIRAGAAELLLVRGPSGGGKSAMVQELQKYLVRHGRFVSGKCDPHQRTPYASIAEASRGLLKSILTEPPNVLAKFRDRLLAALGPNGAVVASLVPELELAIGPQPPAIELEPSAAQRRFEDAFRSFVSVFTSAEHPLVMFLDDLQWADSASLRLLHVLLTGPDRGYFFVLGAYRDNEPEAMRELNLALGELRAAGASAFEIAVAPLERGDVRQLIADALGVDAEVLGEPLSELAALALEKTEGNPFFIGQFLSAIADQGMLRYDTATRRWHFELDRIAAAMVTDNVVELLLARLSRLDPKTRAMLRLSACIGHRFELDTLAAIGGRDSRLVAADLWEALHAGLLVPLDERYRYLHAGDLEAGVSFNVTYQFMHDRVRQAAYSLVEPEQRGAIHLQIGRWLHQRWGDELPDERLFEVVGHMNRGASLLGSSDERRRLARLNLRAAARARDSAAYAAATELAGQCLTLLGVDGWRTDYEVAYAAHVIAIESDAARGDTASAFRLLATLDRHSATGLDRAVGRRLEAAVLTQLNRMSEAILAGVAGADLLGTQLPLEPAALGAAIQAEFGALQQALGGRDVASLAELPLMTDPGALATTQLFTTLLPASLQTRPELLALILCKAIALSLRSGNPPAAPHFYSSYAHLFGVITGNYAIAYEFGRLGVRLGERPPHRRSAGAGELVFASFVAHWHGHISQSLSHYQRGLRASLEVGDFIHFGYCTSHGALTRLYTGSKLELLADEVRRAAGPIRSSGDHINASLLRCVERAIEALSDAAWVRQTDAASVYDDGLEVSAMASNPTLFGMHLIAKSMVLYFAGRTDAALAASDAAQELIAYQRGMLWSVEHVFYRALARAALLRGDAPADRAALLAALEKDAAELRALGASAPANHAHRVALVNAELAALSGDASGALEGYDRALALARDHGFEHHEALANELCGGFHLTAGRTRVARVYLRDAYRGYERWGATVKLQALSARHGELLVDTSRGSAETLSTATSSGTLGGFDLATAVRMTQTIASELVRDRLIERLMRSLVEHAGAQRGFLIVPNGEQLELHASVTVQPDEVRLRLSEPLELAGQLARAVVHYVARTREAVVLADARTDSRFGNDPYVVRALPKSLLCVAMVHHGRLRGVLYLENNAAVGVFDPARLELLQFLAAQAATAIENATLYEELEQRVTERTAALAEANQRLKVSLKQLGDAQRTLIDMSRRAGMADVATSILHNVGNVLNSINVSSELIASMVQQSKSSAVGKLAQLLEQHRDNIVQFLVGDERGRRVPEYLSQLAARIDTERTSMLAELQTLQRNIEHVNVVVAMQQAHAKGGGMIEEVQLADVLNEAIQLGAGALAETEANVDCQCETLPKVGLDRHKLIQILLNLLSNARDAVREANDRTIVLRCRSAGERIAISVEDRGVGVSDENLPRIFNYGFTTKPHGHGFGLHASALAAAELGGTLRCRSAGPGKGATFTLDLPRKQAAANDQASLDTQNVA